MKFAFVSDLEAFLQAEFSAAAFEIQPEPCPPEFSGDLTINCFRMAKALRRPPMAIAQSVAAYLSGHEDVEQVEPLKAFVNVTLKAAAVFRDTVSEEKALLADAQLPEAERHKILVEFSAPNTNKPQHLGHVRNNTIGQATASLLAYVGHTVCPVNLVNDRGIHICKSMLAYQRWGKGATPESAGLKGDHLVGNYYVKYDVELRRQIAALRDSQPELADKSNEELFLETEIGRAAQDMLVAWENHEPAVRELWQQMNSWVLAGFQQTYATMGITFDHTYLESETYMLGKDLVQDGLARGVFQRRDDGAVVIDLSEEKLGEKVVLRSDGTSVYVTQDLGTTLLKSKDYSPDSMIWVVGDEQIYHFKVLFAILRRLGYAWAENLVHMAYGMVNLPNGKMKSREGTVVDADELFAEMASLARQATLERCGADEPEDLDARSAAIGMGALKFMLLKVNPKTTIMFDPEASIKFEGDTGPYVLYAYARISSMLRKAGEEALAEPVDWTVLGSAEEKNLARQCGMFGDVMRKAANELDSSCLAGYLLDLSKSFSRFYRSCPVLAAPTADVRRARLELSSRVRVLLAAGLQALTIQPVENM
jgi:arginyl-tRNA synthetase